jgi:hypothetical protein
MQNDQNVPHELFVGMYAAVETTGEALDRSATS